MSFRDRTLQPIELFRTDQYYIFMKGEYGLWWDRTTGQFLAKRGWDLAHADDPDCLGVVYGIVGKIELPSVVESRLMLIKECAPVGDLPGGKTVYKIKSVVFLHNGLCADDVALGLQPCRKHQDTKPKRTGSSVSGIFDIHQKAAFAKTWGTMKSAANTIKTTTQQAAALATSQVNKSKRRDSKDKEKFERRILEELLKVFNDTDSFYFCLSGDLTNSLQRQHEVKKLEGSWTSVDDRFFWNKHMLQDIMLLGSPLADPWILPIIQGFVQIEHCKVEVGTDRFGSDNFERRYETFTLCLISRRSCYRAGTRYKRRGVDEDGKCANYVETEQIVSYHHHQVSFVQVRGSVPVFWSQPGYKYRPPPCLDKGPVETQVAFEKHFEEELKIYGPVCILNLVEQAGKEKIIWDAYTNHVLSYNNPDVTYVTFDFHEYCRGMHFENVSVLVANIVDIIKDMNYCWKDREGQICSQKGVFRVNCIDCLDRTNVVQTAIAKAVMEIQFTKLGLISPEGMIPANIRNTFQLLWANNGDIISKQYAGTNALKGDYTRTGERKFTGMMKDGMNSANRYFFGHFVDSFRQAGIDVMQGHDVDEDDLENCSCELLTAVNIAHTMVPSVPMVTSELALEPEIRFITAMYHIARYYLSRFKDAYRQATFDMMLGNPVSEDVFSQEKTADEEDAAATAEHVKLVIEDCKKMLISDTEMILGAWGLIDADPVSGDPTETEMDTILILTKDSYYVAEYDDQLDRVTKYQRVLLSDLTLIEFGTPEQSTVSLFKQSPKTGQHCLRLHYTVSGVSGYYHMFRSTNLRFFNNMAVGIKTEEEMIESLKAICEAFNVALEIAGLPAVRFYQGKLERKKSKLLTADGGASLSLGYLDVTHFPHMTRNVSETQLLALKNVGSKALNNMTQQFNKLNKLSHSFNARKQKQSEESLHKVKSGGPMFVIGGPDNPSQEMGMVCTKHSSDEDEEDTTAMEMRPRQTSILDYRSLGSVQPQVREKTVDLILPNVGIIMSPKVSSKTTEALLESYRMTASNQRFQPDPAPFIDNVSLTRVVQNVSIRGHVLTHSRTDLSLDVSGLVPLQSSGGGLTASQNSSLTPSPLRAGGSTTPEITVENTSVMYDGKPGVVLALKSSQSCLSSAQEEGISRKRSPIGDISTSQEALKMPGTKLTPPNTLHLARKLSHSSDEVDRRQSLKGNESKIHIDSSRKGVKAISKITRGDNDRLLGENQRSTSERDLSLNITSSQSESALKSFRTGFTNAVTSPVAVTKDLVLSPFSKLAKGMQHLGANLDPRKLKTSGVVIGAGGIGRHTITEQHADEVTRLQERFRFCRTRLIAL
ncbi:phosphatidylinositide phosphatase SAC2 [Anabrus simplex]|uniref:phosphatidylinositide phosphatase SAC2 n=1 Tax=Anabrus simplex TaxID=316456 RepID=UPI0035A2F701